MITKITILMLMWPVVGFAIVYARIGWALCKMHAKYPDITKDAAVDAMNDAIYGLSTCCVLFKNCSNGGERNRRLLEYTIEAALIWPAVLAKLPEVLQEVEMRFDENIARALRTSEES